MAISLGSPIGADLLYRFYDNKAITPQIRNALQKREDAELAKSSDEDSSASASKSGPATKVSISDQIIRMNIANNSTGIKKEEPAVEDDGKKKPSRYDALTEIRKRLANEAAAAKEAKDAQLKEISDKIAADEAAKNGGDNSVDGDNG